VLYDYFERFGAEEMDTFSTQMFVHMLLMTFTVLQTGIMMMNGVA
jgi:hypothetical protein